MSVSVSCSNAPDFSYEAFDLVMGLPCSVAASTRTAAQAIMIRPAAAAVCGISRADRRQPPALRKAAANPANATIHRAGPMMRAIGGRPGAGTPPPDAPAAGRAG